MMSLADLLGRTLFAPVQLPAGVDRRDRRAGVPAFVAPIVRRRSGSDA